jgi:hypothetical protein
MYYLKILFISMFCEVEIFKMTCCLEDLFGIPEI